jgi:hypothetical protein
MTEPRKPKGFDDEPPEIPPDRKHKQAKRRPWALEIRLVKSLKASWAPFLGNWTVIKRYATEERAKEGMATTQRNWHRTKDTYEYRIRNTKKKKKTEEPR